MPAAGTPIHALGQKLEVLWVCLSRKGTLGSPTLRALAEGAGINLQTLKSARSKGSLTNELIVKLSNLVGFNPHDPRWHDTNVSTGLRSQPDRTYPGRDTVAAFRSMMHQVLDLGGTAVQLRTSSLQHLDTRLAKFQMDASGQQFEEGQSTELLLTTTLETSEEGGVRFGFRRVRIEMTLPAAQRLSVQKRLGHDEPYVIGDAMLTALGGSMNPEWHLTSNSEVLVGEYATRDCALGVLSSLNVGDAVAAKLSAKVRDGDLTVISGGGDLSANQEAVIRALFGQEIAGANDRGGWLTLAVQTLEVRRGDD